jgi:hypothetical protein
VGPSVAAAFVSNNLNKSVYIWLSRKSYNNSTSTSKDDDECKFNRLVCNLFCDSFTVTSLKRL